MHCHYSNHKLYATCNRTSEISICYRLHVPTSLTKTQGLSANLVIYKTVIYLLRLVVTELNKLQAYRPFGARGGAVGWGSALQAGRSRIRFPMVSLEFFIGPAVDSRWHKWVPWIFPGGSKGGRCVGLTTLPPLCADCLEISTSWNLQGLSRPVQGLLYLYFTDLSGQASRLVSPARLQRKHTHPIRRRHSVTSQICGSAMHIATPCLGTVPAPESRLNPGSQRHTYIMCVVSSRKVLLEETLWKRSRPSCGFMQEHVVANNFGHTSINSLLCNLHFGHTVDPRQSNGLMLEKLEPRTKNSRKIRFETRIKIRKSNHERGIAQHRAAHATVSQHIRTRLAECCWSVCASARPVLP
jgi:hypothetical protein